MARWGALVLVVLAACAGTPTPGPPPRPVTFAAFGDTPYHTAELEAVPRLIDEVNAAGVAFSVFLGDLKGGGRCEDAHYVTAVREFNAFTAPLVYTPGDNEWTDCQDSGQDPLERLARLRQVMFPTDESFGRRRLVLDQQRPDYPENARWRVGAVQFATVHVVGSNNHRSDTQEFRARDAAVRGWLHETFVRAAAGGAGAVVIFMQADPAFDVPPDQRAAWRVDGFDGFLEALRQEAAAFARPVVVVHGDGHRYRVDTPWGPGGNLTRVESYGSPDLGWVEITVDPSPRAAEPVRVVPHLVGSFPSA